MAQQPDMPMFVIGGDGMVSHPVTDGIAHGIAHGVLDAALRGIDDIV
jgi:hypothetical protein